MSEEIRRLAERIRATEKQVSALSRPQLSWSTVEGGAIVVKDDQGTPRMTMGVQADGTHTIKHVQGPPPPAPSAPVVTPDLSTLLVAWDGTFTGPRPEDWDRVDVHVSQDENFTPSTGTLRGSIVSQNGGGLTLRVTGGTWHVRLVAVSRAEMHSAPSNPVTVLVEGITDRVKADIEASEGRLSEAQQKALEELAELERKLAGVGAKAEEATLSARNAHNVAVEAQSVADDALAKYGPLDKRAIDAQKAARDAQAKAEQAYSTAEGVSGDVAQAKADADTARREATAAQSSASQAQAKADEAQAEAKQAQSVADDALAKYGPLDKRTIDAQARADQAKQEANQAHLEALASKSLADAAKKRADDAYALAQSKLSGAEVDKRILQSANGKNTITVSTSPPGSSKGIAGDLWRRVDANGHVFAEWTHDGKSWKPAVIRSDMITNLDVHKLTVSGSARVEDAVIEKLWVDGLSARTVTTSRLTVAAGNIYRDPNLLDGELWGSRYQPGGGRFGGASIVVEAGNRQRGTYDLFFLPAGWSTTDRTRVRSGSSYRVGAWVRTSASATGNGVCMYVRQYSEDGSPLSPMFTLPGGSISQGVWTWIENDITVRDDAVFIAVGCFLNSGYPGSARFSDLSVVPKVGAVLIEDGAVTAPKITASQELTAKIAQFLTVRAGQIEADAIDGMTITGATVQTAKSGPRVVLNTAGLSQYDATGTKVVNLSSATGNASIIGEIITGRPGNFRTTITPDLWSNITMKDWDGNDVFASGAGVRIGKDTDAGRYGDIVFAEISGSSGQVIDPETEELEGTTTSTKPALVVTGPGQTMTDRANLGLYGDGSVLLRSKDGAPLTLRSQTNRGDYVRLVGDGSVKIRSTGGAGLSLTKEGQVILKPGLGGKDSARLYMHDSAVIQTRGGDSAILRTGNNRAALEVGAGGGEITMRADRNRITKGSLFYQSAPKTGSSANVFIADDGWMARSTSSRRYKRDIQGFHVPDSLLDVPFRTWIDKGEYERNGDSADGLTRIPGLVAEEVAQACPELVIYDDKGRPDALAGDRIGMAALTLIRRQRDRITRLEERITQMEGAK
ncbi:hypothetical protein QP868_02305 [Brevibacterium sp. UMB1308A]|uniref:hypothetical protein n=1 Tax=Brevibacterium sp. UMB1308A TaxID=3050608 RepID=UPI0025511D22|nr:hypothetical protein [Brevibacterium sp. UMB1308A]MDK8345422.1 hypothetical protein [Brevibacterium sp. UMB1308B]MDK8712731.1 hypothetical protein [Brevibacterium sp. UMB1308A]